MSVPPNLLCGVLGHDDDAFLTAKYLGIYIDGFKERIAPALRTVRDLVGCFADAHALACPCGVELDRDVAWYANLPFGQDCCTALAWYDTEPEDQIDLNLELKIAFPSPDVPHSTVHLMLKPKHNLPNLPWRISMGLRRLDGDLCRVAGSRERSLPTSSDFEAIASTPGCFYVDRYDWIAQRYGGTDVLRPRPRLLVIRRPAGYGKTTFLSTFASYFDSTADRRLFPLLRNGDEGLPCAMLVYSLDFAELRLAASEDMSDDEIREECSRVMRQATQTFLARYGAKLQQPVPNLDENMLPYEAVRVWALKRGCKICLAIDNYTAPFLHFKSIHRNHGQFRRLERAIYAYMLAHIFVDVGTGVVVRGCITGQVFPTDRSLDVLPFADCPPFAQRTEDLTYSPECEHVVGFTRGDVELLVKAFLPDDQDGQAAALSMIGDETIYAPRDVLQVLRESPAAGSLLL
ncbi:hypothetical protein EXIGLDRAFT_834284 [Exidia glandulosa HHB12029]|uniref:AAA-ATPase-like domain-containing protein n=1 Tax=Exidia glandulosa HHB12029 TaxID=1314781 RepID=A0A166AV62_EXIGL|nr:hypothetical protein EXIGLDRAFT_834284 [Exidia glandulosa HHB12029]